MLNKIADNAKGKLDEMFLVITTMPTNDRGKQKSKRTTYAAPAVSPKVSIALLLPASRPKVRSIPIKSIGQIKPSIVRLTLKYQTVITISPSSEIKNPKVTIL